MFERGHDAAVLRFETALFRGRKIRRDGEVRQLLDAARDCIELPLEQVSAW